MLRLCLLMVVLVAYVWCQEDQQVHERAKREEDDKEEEYSDSFKRKVLKKLEKLGDQFEQKERDYLADIIDEGEVCAAMVAAGKLEKEREIKYGPVRSKRGLCYVNCGRRRDGTTLSCHAKENKILCNCRCTGVFLKAHCNCYD